MAIEAVVLFWWDNNFSLVERFSSIGDTLKSDVEGFAVNDLCVEPKFSSRERIELNSNVGVPELTKATQELGSDTAFAIQSHFSMPCWRFDGMTPERTGIVGGVEVWNALTYERLGQVRDIQGDAMVFFSTAGPFTAILESPGADPARVAEVNAKVEDNIQQLLELIFAVMNRTGAVKAALYVDLGWSIPMNAHALFYRDTRQVVRDLDLLWQVWNDGVGGEPPLSGLTDLKQALHPYRSPEQRQELFQAWRELARPIGTPADEEARVRAVLDSGLHDVLNSERSFGTMDFPYVMNAFASRFFLDVMRAGHATPMAPSN